MNRRLAVNLPDSLSAAASAHHGHRQAVGTVAILRKVRRRKMPKCSANAPLFGVGADRAQREWDQLAGLGQGRPKRQRSPVLGRGACHPTPTRSCGRATAAVAARSGAAVAAGCPPADCASLESSKQLQHLLRQLVGLSHHRVASLLQDVGAAEVGGFRREVGIHDAAAGRALVFDRHLQVRNHRVKA